MIDKYDETLQVLVSGYMMKYTMAFNKKNAQNMEKDVTHLTMT